MTQNSPQTLQTKPHQICRGVLPSLQSRGKIKLFQNSGLRAVTGLRKINSTYQLFFRMVSRLLQRAWKSNRDKNKKLNLYQYTRMSTNHHRWQWHHWAWTLLTATIRQNMLREARNKGSPDGLPTCPSRQGSQVTVRHMQRRKIVSELEKHVQGNTM